MNVNLRLPDDIGKQVDAARGDVPRNTWILRAIEARLLHSLVGSPVPVKPLDKEAE